MAHRTATGPRILAEAAGTFVLVFAVVGVAVFDAGFRDGAGGLGVGFVGVALALGLAVFLASVALGPTSGGHFNPAVTVGLAVAGRFPWTMVALYVIAQLFGAVLASATVMLIASGGGDGFADAAIASGFASTGWGALSPGGFSLPAAFLVEAVATAVLVAVVLAVGRQPAPSPLAPLAVGMTLTVAALVAIPVSNGSFNPARSLASAVFGGPEALAQVWMSIAAPVTGAVIAGCLFAMWDRPGRRRSAETARSLPTPTAATTGRA